MKNLKAKATETEVHGDSSARFTVVGLGEMLWDMFPVGKELGGAPTNFAYITGLLGDRALVGISSVGL